MPPRDEETIRPGQKIGEWTVVERESRAGRTFWLCSCSCGTSRSVAAPTLKKGESTSCGCKRVRYRTGTIKRHGRSYDPVYIAWSNMQQRCNNPNHPSWRHYGGRGIAVDPRWDDFATFASDMGPRPDGYSLDRIDGDGPYSPHNCRWASRQQQNRNLATNHRVTYQGETRTVAEWADLTGINYGTLRHRLTRMSVDKALTTPLQRGKALH